MPVIHCYRKCKNNMNQDDRCELPDTARIYIDCCCSGFGKRPLPDPPPMVDRTLVHDSGAGKWGRRSRVVRVWR